MTSMMSDSDFSLGTVPSGPYAWAAVSSAAEWSASPTEAAWEWLALTPDKFADAFRRAWASLLRDRPDIQAALEASPLRALYAPFADEDLALANAGLAEYDQLLDAE